MKKIIFSLLVLLTVNLTSAQESTTVDPYSESVKTCLQGNGTIDYYSQVVDEMFTMLQKQYASKNVPEAVWTELKQVKPETLKELSQMIVSAYRGHFTHDDVKKMNALYATAAGKKMFKNPKALTASEKKSLDAFYASKTGQKIIGSQDSVNKIMTQISEMWSSDLYKSVVDKLTEKGY